MSNVTIDQLGDEIRARLNSFEEGVRDGVKQAVDATMTEMVKDTRAHAQVRPGGGKYKRSIGAVVGENTALAYSKIWRVKSPQHRLAHLLDKGHALRNGGHYAGNAHATNAERRAVETFQRKIEEVIRNAGSEN